MHNADRHERTFRVKPTALDPEHRSDQRERIEKDLALAQVKFRPIVAGQIDLKIGRELLHEVEAIIAHDDRERPQGPPLWAWRPAGKRSHVAAAVCSPTTSAASSGLPPGNSVAHERRAARRSGGQRSRSPRWRSSAWDR